MAKFIYTVLKLLFVIALLSGLTAGAMWITQHQGWPWWAAAAIVGGIVGLVMAAFFIHRYFLRARERQFVQRIIEQDDAQIKEAPLHKRQRMKELQDRWIEAIETLKNSRLRKFGNPLYVLPWYMVLGESDSGKSTAVLHARLKNILTDVGPVKGVSATRNCDWWFFEEAIFLDTAGRYAIPLDESSDNEEWHEFLVLLSKYRKQEPLNGLVLTLPAEKLLNDSEDDLANYGRSLRGRVNELMRTLGVRFPVYILVTKLDLVFGFNELVDLLPEKDLRQAMGCMNTTGRDNSTTMVDTTFDKVGSRLKMLRLQLLETQQDYDPAFLAFPDELETLRNSLKVFAEATFFDNPYQETPLLRGIFFSSGRQAGQAVSRILRSATSVPQVTTVLPNTDNGIFLYDFFGKILPNDRSLFTPIIEFLRWRTITQHLGLISWFLITFALCVNLSLVYLNNMRALETFEQELISKPQFTNNIAEDSKELGKIYLNITDVSSINNDWWLPRLGLTQSKEAEASYKANFCRDFELYVLSPLRKIQEKQIFSLTADTPESEVAAQINLITKQISLYNKRMTGSKHTSILAVNTQNELASIFQQQGIEPDAAIVVSKLLSVYLAWAESPRLVEEQLELSHTWLARLMNLKDVNMHWLAEWANEQPYLPPVHLSSFWDIAPGSLREEVMVPAAFTQEGKKAITAFLDNIESSVANSSTFRSRRKNFEEWYTLEYANAWREFMYAFHRGEDGLRNRQDYLETMALMSVGKGPYISLIQRLAKELRPFVDQKGIPKWVGEVYRMEAVIALWQHKQSGNKKAVTSLLGGTEKKLSKLVTHLTTSGLDVQAAEKDFGDYVAAIGDMIPLAQTRPEIFKATSSYFGSDPVNSPFHKASSAISKMRHRLFNKGGNEILWEIINGPFDFNVRFFTFDASAHLQRLWEQQVYNKVEYMPEEKKQQALFGNKGLVRKFTQKTAAPFLERAGSMWEAKSWHGWMFPFDMDFLDFLQHENVEAQMQQDKYFVKIKPLPLDVNDDAKVEPYGAILTLLCGDKQQTLKNYNYPTEQKFTWKPAECGTTDLQILFAKKTLKKTYSGLHGFQNFLKEFRQGTYTFDSTDFPEAKEFLTLSNVKYINVPYEFNGAEPIVKLFEEKPVDIPLAASEDWGK